MAEVKLSRIRKSYQTMEVIHGVDLEIRSGEFVVFVGPSGCGKSTLLRMVAGLESITGGTLEIGGRAMNEVPAPKRGVSMVFQSYALYPHMSVFDNMAFGLKLAKTPKPEIEERVQRAAGILQMQDYLRRMPRELSGGQRQRVAIGRAIVRDPKVFLFDEPLSNLDAALRGNTRIELAKLHKSLDATMIYVTHDQVEAMTLADRIVVLNQGRIEQVGTPLELYRNPANRFVAGFIANQGINFLPVSPDNRGGNPVWVLPGGGVIPVEEGKSAAARVNTIGVRPEHLSIASEKDAQLSGRLDVVEEFGEYVLGHLELEGGHNLTVKLPGEAEVAPGSDIHMRLSTPHLHLFDDQGVRLH